MNLTADQKAKIITDFSNLKSKDSFLKLLNDVKYMKYGGKTNFFVDYQLNYYIHPEKEKQVNLAEILKSDFKGRYKVFSIKKKSGSDRIIHAPNSGLKMLQTCLNVILQTIYQPHQSAVGFCLGRSIVDNAKIHVGSYYVYNIDLQDFFPSIDQARIWSRLQQPPFNLNEGNKSLVIANMIASICCHRIQVERNVLEGVVVPFGQKGNIEKVIRNVLPQGAPTSPTITNIICERLDKRLSGAAKRFGLRYTRYADDITFSSLKNVYNQNSDFIKELHRIISDQNFLIKENKTRLQKQSFRQEVTGLTVNVEPNVKRRYLEQIRKWIYLWEKYGYQKAETIFQQEYKKTKPILKKDSRGNLITPTLANVLCGKIDFYKMVKGEQSLSYKKLKQRLDKLIKKSLQFDKNSIGKNKITSVDNNYSLTNLSSNIKKDSSLIEALEIIANRGEDGLSDAIEIFKEINNGS